LEPWIRFYHGPTSGDEEIYKLFGQSTFWVSFFVF
jgi:hypothetical protein